MGMVSPRVAPSSSSTGAADRAAKGLGSMSMDDLIRKGRSGEEVWREISDGRRGDDGEMTLEDFLARAGAVRAEDLRVAQAVAVYGVEKQVLGFGNGKGGRERKRSLLDSVDRAALQRQRRMIKNRESAARSRERKQAYTVELETLVTQLEEENARLLKEQEEQNRKRLRQLLETLIPVTERKRPARALRRTCSMQW